MSDQLTPQEIAWLDQEHRRVTETIRRYGVAAEYVIGDARHEQPSFAYSIGLFGLGHPEVLVFGLDDGNAGAVINDVAARVRGGSDLTVGEVLSFPGWAHRVSVAHVPNPGEVLFSANSYYDRPPFASVPAVQLIYDDVHGRFPWDDGYSRPRWLQPEPGSFRA
ncbi:DUF4262 domain-containing protein [Microbacterium arborescens]|uniref:DUF4262 domain-containing protein n=1 Tax=Microbacterium arborescens TaxID=33883 RepID=UPI003C762906